MLVGLLSDAHGNPLGVRHCLSLLASVGVDQTYFLGDAVGYLPGEVQVLEILEAAGVTCLRGNHEAMLLGELALDSQRDEVYQLTAASDRLSSAQRAWLASWPDFLELTIDDRRVMLVHGSPRHHLTEYVYPDSDIDWLAELGYDAIFLGNTHRPFVSYRNGVLIANVGSCGLPRDQGDLPACAVYDAEANSCEILRVRLPAEEVAAQFGSESPAIHPIVTQCLHRQASQPIGTIMERG